MAESKSEPNFSAAESALGYLFQCRVALLLFLQKLRHEPATTLSIEKFDDVAFEKSGTAVELLQTKHHLGTPANLTDASVDLWKTLRIWIAAAEKRAILIPGSVLTIITTANAVSGSAAGYLRARGREPSKALALLRTVASTSTNKDNIEAYDAFKKISKDAQSQLIDAIHVVDAHPTITGLDAALNAELKYSVSSEHLSSLRSRLEGWWLNRVIRHLASPGLPSIVGDELEVKLSDLREQFKLDNLPIDDDLLDLTPNVAAHHDGRLFVQQLRLIGVSNKRIANAMFDFYRAFEQRSRWLRDNLLNVGELGKYETLLKEEWERNFDAMNDRLGPEATETRKCELAKSLYEWAELEASFNIRPRCQAPFVMRGTFQDLADTLRIGWHPEFAERLKKLLQATPGAA